MIIGNQRPRFEFVPTFQTSIGPEAMELGKVAGLELDDWQSHVVYGAMGRREDGKWSAFEVKILVPRQNGKGSILEVRELAGLYLINTDRLLLHTAHEQKTATEHYNRIWTLIDNTYDLRKRVLRHSSAYGREFIQLKPGPTVIIGAGGKYVMRHESSRLMFISRKGSSGRGYTGDFIAYDEDMLLKASEVGSSFPALGARPNAQVWYTGSAGEAKSEQLALVRRRGVRAVEEGVNPGRLYFAEYSINWHTDDCPWNCTEHDDPDTEEAVAKANPAYNIRRMPDSIQAERDGLSQAEFEKEILGVGVYPVPSDAWLVIPKKWFVATADNTKEPPRVTAPIFAIEVAPDRSSAAIGVAGRRPDGFIGVQVVEHREGTSWIVKRVLEIDAKWHPKVWVIDKRTATATVITELERAGIVVETMQAGDVATASGQLYDAFRDDTIRHYGQASIRSALAGVDKRKLSESWAFDRMNSAVDQSPLMAITFAHWGYLRFGVEEDYDATESVHFNLTEIKRLCRIGVYGPDDLLRLYEQDIIDEKDLEALANAGIPVPPH